MMGWGEAIAIDESRPEEISHNCRVDSDMSAQLPRRPEHGNIIMETME